MHLEGGNPDEFFGIDDVFMQEGIARRDDDLKPHFKFHGSGLSKWVFITKSARIDARVIHWRVPSRVGNWGTPVMHWPRVSRVPSAMKWPGANPGPVYLSCIPLVTGECWRHCARIEPRSRNVARIKHHRLIIELSSEPIHPSLPPADYACVHTVRLVRRYPDGRITSKLATAGKYPNALLCLACRKKSEEYTRWYGSDQYLFLAYEKSGPGPLKPPPLPGGMRLGSKISE